ncbi:hypothetical protein GQ53DRAFT_821748 [Thozetella sp. PMI_491]|nr:hypothetical protein GQ53DRAFT_821748 [Thozetella sp. PMI_491]
MSSTLSQYVSLVTKGRTLYGQLVRAIERSSDLDQRLPEIAPNYYTTIEPPSLACIDVTTEDSLANANHPRDDYVFIEVHNSSFGTSGHSQSMYQNYVHSGGKALLCMNNFANRDRFYRQPGQMFWSDLMAVCCSRVMMVHSSNMKHLQAIWRVKIDNQVTQNLIAAICGEDDLAPVDIKAGEDNFFALLGTDHGKGPARMLATYPELFGRRCISQVRVFPRKGKLPDLCWFLEPVSLSQTVVPPPAAPDSPMSRKEKRKHRKAESKSSITSTN